MSESTVRYRPLALALAFLLSTLLAACGRYEGDPGAERSQQQSEVLQDRIIQTQRDR